jgi:hypothetical protein
MQKKETEPTADELVDIGPLTKMVQDKVIDETVIVKGKTLTKSASTIER